MIVRVFNRLAYVLPVQGYVAAGWPSPAEEEANDFLSFDEWLLPNRNASALVTVESDVMRDAGILPGDLVIVERGKSPQVGAIVIAEVEGEWMMRYYGIESGKVVLRAANSTYPPVRAEHIRLIGLVRAVVRKYA